MEHSDWYERIKARCRYIPNGILLSQAVPAGESKRLVYCSRIDRSHAGFLQLLIRKVMPPLRNIFPGMQLEIIGEGPMADHVTKWVEQINLELGEGTVVMSGFRERCMAGGFLVLGVGRVALEALNRGIPVLSVNRERCGPLISSSNYAILSQTNFVDVTAPAATAELLVRSISAVRGQYPAIIADTRKIREKVQTEFAVPRITNLIVRQYREALQGWKSPLGCT